MHWRYHEQDRDVLVIEADESLNSADGYRHVQQLEKLIADGIRLVLIDCSRLQFLNTNGIGLLLLLHKRMTDRQGEARLVNLRGLAADVIRTVRLDRVFQMYTDMEDARQASSFVAPADPR